MNLRSNKFFPKREDWFSYLPFVSPRKSGIDGKSRCGSPKRRRSLNFSQKTPLISTFLLYLCFSVFILPACGNARDRNSLASNENTATEKIEAENTEENQKKGDPVPPESVEQRRLRMEKLRRVREKGIKAIQNRAAARWPGHGPYKFPTHEDFRAVSFPRGTHEAMACLEIPGNILSKLSTEDLIQTCFNYPFIISIGLGDYDSIKLGYERQKKRFNGFRELGQRPDAGSKLINYFKLLSIDPTVENVIFDIKPLKYMNKPARIHLTLLGSFSAVFSDSSIVNHLKLEEKVILLSEGLSKFEEFEKYYYHNPKKYGRNPRSNIIYLIGHALNLLKYKPLVQKMKTDKKFADFINGKSSSIDDAAIEFIIDAGKKALSEGAPSGVEK